MPYKTAASRIYT